jgi:signal peptidase II
MAHGRLIAGVAAGVVAVDAATKALAAQLLDEGRPVHVLGGVYLELYRNYGGPAGVLPNRPVLVSCFAIFAVLVMASVAPLVRTRAFAVVLGLMLGGGLGNLSDRLLRGTHPLRGGVVDWLKPRPGGGSMNLADLSLNLAILVAVLALAREAVRKRDGHSVETS